MTSDRKDVSTCVGAGTAGTSWLQATNLHYEWIEVALVLVFESPRSCSREVRALRGLFLADFQDRGKFGRFEASCCEEVDQPIIECKYYGSAKESARWAILNNRRRESPARRWRHS